MPGAKRVGRRKQSASVPVRLDRRLLSYAIAAGATLAASAPSRAEVLFTPNNSFLKPPSSLVIDLNHDGVADFLLVVKQAYWYPYGMVGEANMDGFVYSNQLEARPHHGVFVPVALKRGQLIGSQAPFRHYPGVLATGHGAYVGSFANIQNKFLGVKLVVKGEVHFGWIGFRRVDARETVQVTLAGWAYETDPNTPIVAGDLGTAAPLDSSISPTSLEVLSAGHSGIEQRRKRTTVAGGH